MAKYQQAVSLGFFCSPAMELQRISRRHSSGPFDWLIAEELSVLLTLIDNGFEDFLTAEYFHQMCDYPQGYRNKKWNVDFYHDFSPLKSFSSQYDVFRKKYERRIQRFYETISKPTLFIRYVFEDEIPYLNENYPSIVEALKKYNPENDIIFVSNDDITCSFAPHIPVYYVAKDQNDTVARQFLTKNDALLQFITEQVEPSPEKKDSAWTALMKLARKVLYKILAILHLTYKHPKQCHQKKSADR